MTLGDGLGVSSKVPDFVVSYKHLDHKEQEDVLRLLLEINANSHEESIKWNKELVLKYLKENYVDKQSAKISIEEWTIIKLSLPKRFGIAPVEFFVSKNSNINTILLSSYDGKYSIKEICSLLKFLKEYMKRFWVDIDWDIDDYENVLKSRDKDKKDVKWCEAWKILKEITGLKGVYVLSDTDEDGNEIVFDCSNDDCCFRRQRKDGVFPSGLLCKVSKDKLPD